VITSAALVYAGPATCIAAISALGLAFIAGKVGAAMALSHTGTSAANLS